MNPDGCTLVIPVTGLLDLYHGEHYDQDYYERVLTKKGVGTFTTITATTNGEGYVIGTLVNPVEPVNARARQAVESLFGWHMIFTGPVYIAGLTPEQATSIIERLS